MAQTVRCPVCDWPMTRIGGRLRCTQRSCRGSVRLPEDQKMKDLGAPRLPGMEDEHGCSDTRMGDGR